MVPQRGVAAAAGLRSDGRRPSLQGLGIGVLVSLLFSMVPLLEVRNVKPSLLLRQDSRRRGRASTG